MTVNIPAQERNATCVHAGLLLAWRVRRASLTTVHFAYQDGGIRYNDILACPLLASSSLP